MAVVNEGTRWCKNFLSDEKIWQGSILVGRGAANGVFALINVNVFLFIIGLRCFNDIFNTNKSTWRVMFRWAYHGILSHIRMNRGN